MVKTEAETHFGVKRFVRAGRKPYFCSSKKTEIMRKGILQKQYPFPVRRYVQTMSLRDNPELIALYRKAHSEPDFWPEIGEGIRAVGILEMELYILGTRLVMIVDMPDELDWDEVMARLAQLPRQAEWEDHVAQFQSCAKGSTSDEKWQMMERIFHLYE